MFWFRGFVSLLIFAVLSTSCGEESLREQSKPIKKTPEPQSKIQPKPKPEPKTEVYIKPKKKDVKKPDLSCEVNNHFTAKETFVPTDIIWIVDSSGSMKQENQTVKNNLNRFSSDISNTRIDHHVILLGDKSKIKVPPPLGTSKNFLHISVSVASKKPFNVILDNYPKYKHFLRPNSVKHIVVVTDDSSKMSVTQFGNSVRQLKNPGFGPKWVFHSIVAQGSLPIIGCLTGANIGTPFMSLSNFTGGIIASVCDSDWSQVFKSIVNSIQKEAALPCQFDIPKLKSGSKKLNPQSTSMTYNHGSGGSTTVSQVNGKNACQNLGWYYDNPKDPKKVIACPKVCDQLRKDYKGKIDLKFACKI